MTKDKIVSEAEVMRRAERVIRNMPISNIQFRRTACKYGRILYAYGKTGEGRYMGAWVIDQPTFVMRPIEFTERATLKQVTMTLVNNAAWFLQECAGRGLLRAGARFGEKY